MGTEVFIIGGGPAGLAAAIAARGRGFDVTVADGAHPPIDKACGEGLMPDGLSALRRLGVTLADTDAQVFRGLRFIGDGSVVEAAFPKGYALGVRRTVLHTKLLDTAAAAGVRMMWDYPVSSAEQLPRDCWIIGADGFHSRVRRWAGLEPPARARARFGFREHYQIAPWSDYMELHWGAACQIYVTPTAPREVCVALISRDPHLRLDDAFPQFPLLAARLDGVARSTAERGAVTANRSLARVYRGRFALIGDASGSVDAITGEGLCLAFHQALALAESLAIGDLALYQRTHRRLARRPTFMSNLMLTMDRRTWLRERVLRAMAAEPRIFSRMLSFHLCVPKFC